jgi:hypothetical protein
VERGADVKWFRESKREYIEVETMNGHHARNALAKLDRGDYLDEDGNPPSVQEHITLRSELQRRITDLDQEQASESGGPDV